MPPLHQCGSASVICLAPVLTAATGGGGQNRWGHSGGLQHPDRQSPPYFAEEITTECLSDSRILARWKATESA